MLSLQYFLHAPKKSEKNPAENTRVHFLLICTIFNWGTTEGRGLIKGQNFNYFCVLLQIGQRGDASASFSTVRHRRQRMERGTWLRPWDTQISQQYGKNRSIIGLFKKKIVNFLGLV